MNYSTKPTSTPLDSPVAALVTMGGESPACPPTGGAKEGHFMGHGVRPVQESAPSDRATGSTVTALRPEPPPSVSSQQPMDNALKKANNRDSSSASDASGHANSIRNHFKFPTDIKNTLIALYNQQAALFNQAVEARTSGQLDQAGDLRYAAECLGVVIREHQEKSPDADLIHLAQQASDDYLRAVAEQNNNEVEKAEQSRKEGSSRKERAIRACESEHGEMAFACNPYTGSATKSL